MIPQGKYRFTRLAVWHEGVGTCGGLITRGQEKKSPGPKQGMGGYILGDYT